jgi:cytochrome P450
VLADLLNATDDAGAALSDAEVRDALITMLTPVTTPRRSPGLGAGADRIAPCVIEKIRRSFESATGGDPPRADQLDALPYLDATIRESLRMRTIFSFVVRLTKAAVRRRRT